MKSDFLKYTATTQSLIFEKKIVCANTRIHLPFEPIYAFILVPFIITFHLSYLPVQQCEPDRRNLSGGVPTGLLHLQRHVLVHLHGGG